VTCRTRSRQYGMSSPSDLPPRCGAAHAAPGPSPSRESGAGRPDAVGLEVRLNPARELTVDLDEVRGHVRLRRHGQDAEARRLPTSGPVIEGDAVRPVALAPVRGEGSRGEMVLEGHEHRDYQLVVGQLGGLNVVPVQAKFVERLLLLVEDPVDDERFTARP